MKTFDLTENELRAAMVLVADCLDSMGGNRPSDLEYDEFTWQWARTLIDAGWSRFEAAGTYGSLAEKGFIQLNASDNPGGANDVVATQGWKWLDTVWDANQNLLKD